MIKVSYNNGIVLLPETMSDNDSLIEMFQTGNFLVNYVNNAWIVNEEQIQELNMALAPLRRFIIIEPSFTEWKNRNNIQRPVKPAHIRCGVVESKIYKGDQDLPHKAIEDVTKYFWKPAMNHPKFKAKKWDGYITLYKRWEHTFPTGLLSDVVAALKKEGIECTIEYVYDQKPAKQFNWSICDNIIPDPDQLEAIEAGVKGIRGVVKAPTGFGKTAVLAKRLTVEHSVCTLFVANKKSLLDDAAEEFRTGIKGIKPTDVIQIKDGWFGQQKLAPSMTWEDIKPLTAPIIVATIQSLHARLKDPRTAPHLLDWLHNHCRFVMVDECQATGTKVWDEVLDECWAPYRIYLSATPRRTDGATIKLMAGSGPILFTTTAEEQIEKGRLCELDINYMVYNHKVYNDFDADVNYNESYKAFISENMERNEKCVLEPTLEMLNEGRHVLVLIQYIEHGHILKDMFVSNGISPDDIRFVWGDTPDKMRTSAIQEFRKGDFKIMIGSTIFDAGVNIPLISGVILCGAGNSDITLIQRIGRGARNCNYEDVLGYLPEFMQKNHGKKVTRVVDIMDTNIKFFHKQAKNRYYNAIEEFGKSRVHIVGGDESAALGKTSKQRTQTLKDVDQFSAQLSMLEEFKI